MAFGFDKDFLDLGHCTKARFSDDQFTFCATFPLEPFVDICCMYSVTIKSIHHVDLPPWRSVLELRHPFVNYP